MFLVRLRNFLRLYIMYTCISFLAIFSLAEESKSYRLDNMNESYDDDTGNNKLINLLTSNSKPHFKCVGGDCGINVCVCVCVCGGGGVNSALIQYCICSFPVNAPKYFIVLLFNTAVN